MERIQKRYLKCTLNLDSCTPDYVIYKETIVGRIGTIAGSRTVFEEKPLNEGYRKLIIECVKEGKEKEIIR